MRIWERMVYKTKPADLKRKITLHQSGHLVKKDGHYLFLLIVDIVIKFEILFNSNRRGNYMNCSISYLTS